MNIAGFDFSLFRSGVKSAGDHVRELKQKIEQLKRQREEIEAAPITRSELVARVAGFIDSEAARYPTKALTAELAEFSRSELVPNDYQPLLIALTGRNTGGGGIHFRHLQSGLCYLFRDQMKASLAQAIARMPYAAEGLPAAQRVRELARLDREITEAEAEYKALQAELAALRDET